MTVAAATPLRIRPWHRDRGMAYVAPLPGRGPTPGDVRRCLESLADQGYRGAVTPALDHAERAPFLAAGMEVRERLHLLHHDLRRLPAPTAVAGVRIRRARDRDVEPISRLDRRAFASPFWHLGPEGLRETVAATPSHRFRVAWSQGVPSGYAVVGRSARWCYLQRVAVDPVAQGRGIGRALVVDALAWAARRRARQLLVNTQLDNRAAMRLYRSLGFELAPDGLAVLEAELTT